MPTSSIIYLKQPQVFVNVSSDREVVNAQVSDDLIVVDQEGSAKGKAGIVQDSILISDVLLDVGKERDVEWSKSSIGTIIEGPSSMDEVRVNGASDHLTVVLLELSSLVAELHNFCGADEGEIKRVEKEEQPLALEVIERDLLELVGCAEPGLSLEVGGNLADSSTDHLRSHKDIFKIHEKSRIKG